MLIIKKFYLGVLLVLMVSMVGCSSGGSSSSGSGVRDFQSWSQVETNKEYEMSGISLDGEYTADETTWAITSISTANLSENSSVNFTMDDNNLLTDVSIKTPTTSVSFSKSSGDNFYSEHPFIVGLSDDGTKEIYAADPYIMDWNYQTFGFWLTGQETGAGIAGSISAGAPTAIGGIPTSGTGTYTGFSGGAYIDPAGNDFMAIGELKVVADFGPARSLDFSATDTHVISRYSGNIDPNPDLDLHGTLTYSADSNNFSGNITSANDSLSGTAHGQFYGPSAQELGGVFTTTGSGIESYHGSFGAKRVD